MKKVKPVPNVKAAPSNVAGIFEKPKKGSIAAAVKQELDADMSAFGYEIVNVLVTDIVPDAKVKSAMAQLTTRSSTTYETRTAAVAST